MIKKLARLLSTIRYLKPVQLYYRIYFVVFRKPVVAHFRKKAQRWTNGSQTVPLSFTAVTLEGKAPSNGRFTFLNQEVVFTGKVDWNESKHGKLWTYKLNYFDFITYSNSDPDYAMSLIEDYCDRFGELTSGLEPYPVSLRGINWIKFFITRNISNPRWNHILRLQFEILFYTTEYHLLGNHLLENGLALIFGGYYFRNEKFYRKGKKIVEAELREQVLQDGGHFERSPMYHAIILHRVLDTLNLANNNPWKQDSLKDLLHKKASAMAGYLQQIHFSSGDLPPVNDTVENEYLPPAVLLAYAKLLGVSPAPVSLKDSGYRMVKKELFELFIDAGNIGPDYIPGHAHSDTFNFLVNVKGKPMITETGTSTYLPGERRNLERKTSAHNTVVVSDTEQSDVWSTFRVGRRAKIVSLTEGPGTLSASHDGFSSLGITHERSFLWNDTGIIITDTLNPRSAKATAEAWIHFHPSVAVHLENNVVSGRFFKIDFSSAAAITMLDYQMAEGFNVLSNAKCVRVTFSETLQTCISLMDL